MSDRIETLRIGMVGSGYIANVHSAAYRTVAGTYPDVPRSIVLAATADTAVARAEALAGAWSWERTTDDWRAITRSDDVDVVDVCVPNVFHAEIAIDALRHGKHVICEKPLAHDLVSATAMRDAAAESGLVSQVCFYYRLWPAISWAKSLLAEGSLGPVTHFRGWMLQDYASNPVHDLGWRARRADAGAGALGDLGSHIIDIAQYLVGDIASLCATTRTLVARRPAIPDIDDIASMLVEFDGGAAGVLEASWALRGHQCDLGFDLVCEKGAIRFCWERSNEIEILTGDVTDPQNGFRRVLIGAGQPDVGRFVATPGQAIGYRDAFTIGLGKTLAAIANRSADVGPSFEDGLAVARVVDAAQRSASARRWVDIAI